MSGVLCAFGRKEQGLWEMQERDYQHYLDMDVRMYVCACALKLVESHTQLFSRDRESNNTSLFFSSVVLHASRIYYCFTPASVDKSVSTSKACVN